LLVVAVQTIYARISVRATPVVFDKAPDSSYGSISYVWPANLRLRAQPT